MSRLILFFVVISVREERKSREGGRERDVEVAVSKTQELASHGKAGRPRGPARLPLRVDFSQCPLGGSLAPARALLGLGRPWEEVLPAVALHWSL